MRPTTGTGTLMAQTGVPAHPWGIRCMNKTADDPSAADSRLLPNRWDDTHARQLSPCELLLYRSNLLGADKRVTNFGGGNTSAKLTQPDPLTGNSTRVLWVK